MFFALTAAIHDAGIAAWDAKRVFDSVRPVTAIPFLFHGQTIMAWGGPYMGTVVMDAFVTFAAGNSVIEPGVTPASPVELYWATFTDAANQAGISRRYGGIHFEMGDLVGRATGRLVGSQAWFKALRYFRGAAH